MPDIVLLFLTVPAVTGVIGWVTNWAAVKMIFHPANFIGVGPIGWQAIMTKQGDKFATGVADMVTDNLATAPELAQRLDPKEVQEIIDGALGDQTEAMVRDCAEIVKPGAWDELPDHVKQMALSQVKLESDKLGVKIFEELSEKAEDYLDLNKLVFSQLSGANIQRLIRLTREIAAAEFKFIELYGGVFGFLIGLMQITVWSVMQVWWLMPVFGVLVGLVTNYLAIQMIFRPQEPKKFFGFFTYQGLFAKRQKTIAADYGRVAEAEILTPDVIIDYITQGESGAKIAVIITQTISDHLDAQLKQFAPMLPMEVTPEMMGKVKALIAQRMLELAPTARPEFEKYLADKLGVRETVETKLSEMPKDQFERILRGIFEEDELTLIIVGGVLGGLVGVGQGMLVLSL